MKTKQEEMRMAITHLEYDQTSTRHVLEDVERKIEDCKESVDELKSELDVRFNVTVSDVENMIAESEDRIVEKVVANCPQVVEAFKAVVTKDLDQLGDNSPSVISSEKDLHRPWSWKVGLEFVK